MRSEFFKNFGIPDAECEIEVRRDDTGIPRLWFRSQGNPLVGLDLSGASQLRQMLAQAGEVAQANEIDRLIEEAKRLDRTFEVVQPRTSDDAVADSLPVNAEPTASTSPVMVEAKLSGSSDLRAEPLVIRAQATFAQHLSERTAEIRDAARSLVHAINDQVQNMKASRPNDAAELAKHDELVAFLEMIAAGLTNLANALDDVIRAGTGGTPEPVLLGRAGDIARRLGSEVTAWIERNGSNLVDCTMRVSVFAASFVFLQASGVDGITASIVSGLVNASLPARTRKS